MQELYIPGLDERQETVSVLSKVVLERLNVSPANFHYAQFSRSAEGTVDCGYSTQSLPDVHVARMFVYGAGELGAHIHDPLPRGVAYRTHPHRPAEPYIRRLVRMERGVISVDTTTATPPVYDGPAVTLQADGAVQFSIRNRYDTTSKEFETYQGLAVADENAEIIREQIDTVAISALPEEIQGRRIRVVEQSLAAIAATFEAVLFGDSSIQCSVASTPKDTSLRAKLQEFRKLLW